MHSERLAYIEKLNREEELSREDAQALIDELKRGPAWQPLATAPKDGTWILGWAESDRSPYRVSWGRNFDHRLTWCTSFASFHDDYITHWMPMPTVSAKIEEDA